MEAVLGLLLLLLGVSHGEETGCDGRWDGAQCYGDLGGTVILRLMDSALEIPRYEWQKENQIILKWRDSKIVSNTIENRSLFIPNTGTFVINNLSRNDTGLYTLTMFDLNGRQTEKRSQQLFLKEQSNTMTVLAGVFSVLLVFLIAGAAFIFIQRKKHQQKGEDSEPEVTYADLTVVQPQESQVKQKMEEEVEYSQVKFSAERNTGK